MKTRANERGSTLALAMMLLLIFLGLTVAMTFNAQSEIQMANGVKLRQFYKMAGISAMERTRANIPDYWVSADPFGSVDRKDWRFGTLLAAVTPDLSVTAEDYGGLMPDDNWGNEISMNGGLMDLTYKVWVANNPDDPAYTMTGMDLGDGPLDPRRWDLDGKVVITIEVFGADPNNPVATQSALVGLSGADFIVLHDDAVREGDIFEAGNLGRGSSGSASRVTLDEVDDDLSSATP